MCKRKYIIIYTSILYKKVERAVCEIWHEQIVSSMCGGPTLTSNNKLFITFYEQLNILEKTCYTKKYLYEKQEIHPKYKTPFIVNTLI